MSEEQLIVKYRPQSFDQVVGHKTILTALQRALGEDTRPRAYLLTGPSGVGKTTIARLIAKRLGCAITEIDAASNAGVENTRQLVASAQFRPLSAAGRTMVLLDEVQSISTKGWEPLLKITEEPPEHLFFAFCTTQPEKVPTTIATRCFSIALQPLTMPLLDELLTDVSRKEGWQVSATIRTAIVQSAEGSPRKSLSLLQALHCETDPNEIRRIIRLQNDDNPAILLARALLNGIAKWTELRPILQRLEDQDLADVTVDLCRYVTGALANARSEADAARAFDILNAFTFPTASFEKRTLFYTALGRLVLMR